MCKSGGVGMSWSHKSALFSLQKVLPKFKITSFFITKNCLIWAVFMFIKIPFDLTYSVGVLKTGEKLSL